MNTGSVELKYRFGSGWVGDVTLMSSDLLLQLDGDVNGKLILLDSCIQLEKIPDNRRSTAVIRIFVRLRNMEYLDM